MKGLDLYKWIAGSMQDFVKPFHDNEALYNQAQNFWRHLESTSVFIISVFIITGIVMAVIYYWPYNEMPGRHYHPKHWLIFLSTTFLVSLLVTLSIEYVAVEPKLQSSFWLELRIAIGNAIYASLLYFVISVVWCNLGKTNACRIFKI